MGERNHLGAVLCHSLFALRMEETHLFLALALTDLERVLCVREVSL